jgi:hypothetical protein
MWSSRPQGLFLAESLASIRPSVLHSFSLFYLDILCTTRLLWHSIYENLLYDLGYMQTNFESTQDAAETKTPATNSYFPLISERHAKFGNDCQNIIYGSEVS